MSTEIIPKGFLPTDQPDLFFEDNAVGHMKKEVWEARITLLQELGKETLIFCGTEDVSKIIITQLLDMVGLKARLINPFITIVFSLFCLVASKFTLVEFLSTYFPWTVGKANVKTAQSV